MPGAARPQYADDISRTRLSRVGQRGAGGESRWIISASSPRTRGPIRREVSSGRRSQRLEQQYAPVVMGPRVRGDDSRMDYLFLFTGLRFSMNAAIPSERSSSA